MDYPTVCQKQPDQYPRWWRCNKCKAIWLGGVYSWECYERQNMSAVENIEDEFKDTKYPHLRVATGGKGPPDGPVDNYLAEFEVGTTFVARQRNSEVDYNLYYVLYKDLPEVVLLKWQLPDGKVLDYYVDPVRFSRLFTEKKILSVIKPKQEEPQQEAEVSENEHNREPTNNA